MNINLIPRAARLGLPRLRAALAGACGLLVVSTASAWTSADATTLFNAYNTAFYVPNGGNAYYKNDTTGGNPGFWTQANIIEMAEDAYDRTGSTATRDMIAALCTGFTQRHGTSWSWNEFNDDVMWACIAFSRAYQITGNTAFRDRAKANFDMVWNRAWSTDLGGGLWWKTNNQSKNACVNGPGAIAACYIYQMTGTSSYLTKAQQIFDWQRNTIFSLTTGRIADNIGANGTINWGATSYNQGTFVGAGNLLYQLTGDRQYYKDAWLAARFTRDTLCVSGRFPAEGKGAADGAGFAGIGVRWIARFASEQRAWAYFYPWLKYNADLAWNVRRSDNLSWNQWALATASGLLRAWECFPSVTALQVVPSNNPSPAFMLVNKNSGKSADLIDGNVANGSVINQWAYDYANLDQHWSFVPTEDGDHFMIVSLATGYASGKVLCVSGNSTANGAQIHLWDYNSHAGQQWDLVYVSDGWYKIKNVNSGKVLEVAGASTADGAKLQQGTDTGSNAQLFRLHPVGDYFIQTLANGKYLAVQSSSGANGSAIIQSPWQNASTFKWHFYSNSEGWERVSSLVNLNRAITIDGGSVAAGADALFWDYDSTYQAEKIRILPLTNGKFKFYFKHSGMVWDIPGGSSADNVPLEQNSSNSYNRQQFRLERTY